MAGQDKQPDPTGDSLIIIGGIVLFFGVIFYFFGYEIKKVYLSLKLMQFQLISTICPEKLCKFSGIINSLETRSIYDWTWREVMQVGKTIGYIINIPFIILLGWMSYKLYEHNPLKRFTRVLNMQSLKESEKEIWPYIAPMVNTKLIDESFEEGPYSMALTPYDWCVKHKLFTDVKNLNSLEKVKAEKLFSNQLGKLFDNTKKLRKHERALLAIMAAHGCGDKKGAMKAVNDMALSVPKDLKKMPNLKSAEPLMKYLDDPKVLAILNNHSYTYTIFASMMQFARTTGVFPSSYFVWLKPRDRVLWYVINTVGRQVAFIEVAGIFAHWRAEQTAHHKIETPMAQKALEGLEKALNEVKV